MKKPVNLDLAMNHIGEITESDVVVCAYKGTPTPFDDNMEGVCSVCGAEVIFRPYAAPGKKVCIACLPTVIAAEEGTKQ